MTEVKPVEFQCGTCRFAKEFDYGPSPSGPQDGVHCANIDHARFLDSQQGLNEEHPCSNLREFRENGFLSIFRLEILAEEDFKCPSWEPNWGEIREQMFPSPDEAPMSSCPWCGEEYNVREDSERAEADYVTIIEPVPGTNEVARHKCGGLVRFIGTGAYSD